MAAILIFEWSGFQMVGTIAIAIAIVKDIFGYLSTDDRLKGNDTDPHCTSKLIKGFQIYI